MERKKKQGILKCISYNCDGCTNHYDSENERYVYWKKSVVSGQEDIPIYISVGDEYINSDGTKGVITEEILMLLDSIDEEEKKAEQKYNSHKDKLFANKLKRYESVTSEEILNPWESIEDARADRVALLFEEYLPVDTRMQKLIRFMDMLTDVQRNLIYDHLGACKYLEDIRHEEESKTGVAVTQQAVSKRYNNIIAKLCRLFGVEKPKREKKQK